MGYDENSCLMVMEGGACHWNDWDCGTWEESWYTYEEDWYYYNAMGQCENDLSSADSYGDDCDLYDTNAHWCGGYDTEDFNSAEQCCVCGGGMTCENDLSSADSFGDDCDLYDHHPYWCGGYDTEDFNSYEQCCICQEGGDGFYYMDDAEWYEEWYYTNDWYYWNEMDDMCENDLSSADSFGDDCDLYDTNAHWCGGYDTEDFNSAEQCCVCGGGSECVNDLSTADSWGDDCDLYDHHPYWCGGYDTEDFNSYEQCCICQEMM